MYGRRRLWRGGEIQLKYYVEFFLLIISNKIKLNVNVIYEELHILQRTLNMQRSIHDQH